jgi:hypothetical protein
MLTPIKQGLGNFKMIYKDNRIIKTWAKLIKGNKNLSQIKFSFQIKNKRSKLLISRR